MAGLNPHCGEGGIFGARKSSRSTGGGNGQKEGIDVKGPISGDTVFYRALKGEFDLVVAQYHDQGHIPTKLIAFDETGEHQPRACRSAVPRSTHGTAHDIAWTGKANHVNMRERLSRDDGGRAAAPVAA